MHKVYAFTKKKKEIKGITLFKPFVLLMSQAKVIIRDLIN